MRSELGLKRIQNFIMSDTEELHVGDFNPSTYEHVLPEGAHDFNDYDSEYEEQHPELGFTDEQVEVEVAKLDPEDKKFYEEYREFLDTYVTVTCLTYVFPYQGMHSPNDLINTIKVQFEFKCTPDNMSRR